MDSGKILLVNLAKGKIGEAPAMLFVDFLVTMLAFRDSRAQIRLRRTAASSSSVPG